MTDLAKLSAAATQGEWFADGPAHNRIIWSDPDNRVAFMAHSDGADPERDIVTPAFIVALVNAYRTGQLVERDAVAGVVEALKSGPIIGPTESADAFRRRQDQWLRDVYSPALTAIKGGGDADG